MTENILAKQELLKSNIATLYGIDRSQFEKGGEGSKGGKVIGHTKSGKPIYATKNPKNYKDFTKEDHTDAEKLHVENSNNFIEKNKNVDFSKLNAILKVEHANNDFNAKTHRTISQLHKKEASKLEKSEENTIEKSHVSDAFRYSDSSAFKIDLSGAEIKEKCESAIPFLYAQKEALKEIAQDALNQCEGITPLSVRKENNISYTTFSWEQYEPKKDQYSNTYPEKSDCQKQMDRYNSAIYQMLELSKDIVTLQTLANTVNDAKEYSLTLNQIVAISMGYTEDELKKSN